MKNSELPGDGDHGLGTRVDGGSEPDYCPVHAAISVLQEKWTLHIVRALLDGPMGFNELGRAVGGCNPATLKARLDHLGELGLVTRTVHSSMPPRTSYELAQAGVDLQRVIMAIDGWGREHLAEPANRQLEPAGGVSGGAQPC